MDPLTSLSSPLGRATQQPDVVVRHQGYQFLSLETLSEKSAVCLVCSSFTPEESKGCELCHGAKGNAEWYRSQTDDCIGSSGEGRLHSQRETKGDVPAELKPYTTTKERRWPVAEGVISAKYQA